MTQSEDPLWQARIRSLRDRLEALEIHHRESIQSLRSDILALEVARTVVPEPARPNEPEIAPGYEAIEILPAAVIEPEPEPEPFVVPAPVAVHPAAAAPPPLPGRTTVPPAPPARPPVLPPPVTEGSFELRFGRVWLVRFGVALLLTGLVLLGNFAYKNWVRELPPGLRLTGLFALAMAMAETGRRLARRQTLATFGEVILAGGMAFFYYCTFAAHHVGRLKVIESPAIAALCLLGAAAAIGAVSWFRQARTTAVLGILLASYSTMLQPIGWLSCVSNALLAVSGLLLMTRHGWAVPGVASMVGTYGSFLGWQILGASQGDLKDPSALWFLPPVWAIFTLPGVLGKFRTSLSPHGRAWFTGANNGVFFLLFSVVWVERFGEENYWILPALMGLVLLGLGVAGRRASEVAGGVNVSQGLLLLTWALVLKLDGFHLALALGFQSLTLSLAYQRFRGRSELAFSALAALGAFCMVMGHHFNRLDEGLHFVAAIPVWAAGVTTGLIGAASLVLTRTTMQLPATSRSSVRWVPVLLLLMAVAASIGGWVIRLPEASRLPVLAGFALGFTIVATRLDRRWQMPELPLVSLIYLAAAAVVALFTPVNGWLGLAAVFSLAGTWFWHRLPGGGSPEGASASDLRAVPDGPAWAFALGTIAAVWRIYGWPETPGIPPVIALGVAGTALVGLAAAIRTSRLAPAAAMLLAAALLEVVRDRMAHPAPDITGLSILIGLGLASLAILTVPAVSRQLEEIHRELAALIARAVLFLSVLGFWHELNTTYLGDGLALVAAVLIAAAVIRKKPVVAEAWGYLAIGVLWLIGLMFFSWMGSREPSWRGAGVVAAALCLSAAGRHLGTSSPRAAALITPTSAISALLASVWVTQMLVWRHGWDHATVLWTVLGFVAVGAGLLLRLRMFRFTGFGLLGLAVAKLFTMDVWEFNAFTRVISFIALGVAMILLGLFYNRFAAVLKRLIEDDQDAKA